MIVLALYTAAALVACGLYDRTKIHPIAWISIAEYLGVLLLAGTLGAGLWLAGQIKNRRSPGSRAASA